jgi:hypothetical protein
MRFSGQEQLLWVFAGLAWLYPVQAGCRHHTLTPGSLSMRQMDSVARQWKCEFSENLCLLTFSVQVFILYA